MTRLPLPKVPWLHKFFAKPQPLPAHVCRDINITLVAIGMSRFNRVSEGGLRAQIEKRMRR